MEVFSCWTNEVTSLCIYDWFKESHIESISLYVQRVNHTLTAWSRRIKKQLKVWGLKVGFVSIFVMPAQQHTAAAALCWSAVWRSKAFLCHTRSKAGRIKTSVSPGSECAWTWRDSETCSHTFRGHWFNRGTLSALTSSSDVLTANALTCDIDTQ